MTAQPEASSRASSGLSPRAPSRELSEASEALPEALALICQWYAAVRRPLPWREDRTPYHVWIAEIMLQQTRIEAVIPYYHRFLRELPDVPALAAVPEDRLLKLWEGLGYYSRARNLKKAALLMMESHGGTLPASAEELRKLPGVGEYTAGAIASIAYGLPEPAVDGNVLRVMSRLLALGDDISPAGTRRGVTGLLRARYPSGEAAGLLTEGIMELGETVCLPNGLPRCEICPVRGCCLAHQSGAELSYPVRSEKKPRRIEEKTVFLLHRQGRFAIRKRPSRGLLAGLWEFPNTDARLSPEEVFPFLFRRGTAPFPSVQDAGFSSARETDTPLPSASAVRPCGEARHVFTHVEWHMTGYLVSCEALSRDALPEAFPGCLWKSPDEIAAEYPLPTAFRHFQHCLRAF